MPPEQLSGWSVTIWYRYGEWQWYAFTPQAGGMMGSAPTWDEADTAAFGWVDGEGSDRSAIFPASRSDV